MSTNTIPRLRQASTIASSSLQELISGSALFIPPARNKTHSSSQSSTTSLTVMDLRNSWSDGSLSASTSRSEYAKSARELKDRIVMWRRDGGRRRMKLEEISVAETYLVAGGMGNDQLMMRYRKGTKKPHRRSSRRKWGRRRSKAGVNFD